MSLNPGSVMARTLPRSCSPGKHTAPKPARLAGIASTLPVKACGMLLSEPRCSHF